MTGSVGDLAVPSSVTGVSPAAILVVQGGGMRGVYSMGALRELTKLGFGQAFDLVIGASAGAMNAAYFLAGQAAEAVDIYVDALSGRRFINPARLWKLVDIDFLVDGVLRQQLPLNLAAIARGRGSLEIVLTDADSGRPRIARSSDGSDIYELLRASCALPGLYNRRVRIGNDWFVDGGLTDPLPIERALSLRPSVVVVIATRESSFRQRQLGRFAQLVAKVACRGHSPSTRELVARGHAPINKALDVLSLPPTALRTRTEIVFISPSCSESLVTTTTRDAVALRRCADLGAYDVATILKSKTGLDELERLRSFRMGTDSWDHERVRGQRHGPAGPL